MLKMEVQTANYDKLDEQSDKKRFPLGKHVKKALKDYLRDYKGHGSRPLFPSPKKGEQPIKE